MTCNLNKYVLVGGTDNGPFSMVIRHIDKQCIYFKALHNNVSTESITAKQMTGYHKKTFYRQIEDKKSKVY